MSDQDLDNSTKAPPDHKGGIDVLERTKPKLKRPRMFNVLLLNDDFTPMDFVVFVLQKIFNKSEQEAATIMIEVHKKGRGIAGTYTYEVAEQKQLETMKMAHLEQHPLQVVLEPAPEA